MREHIRKIFLFLIVVLVIGATYLSRVRIGIVLDGWRRPQLPEAVEFQGASDEPQEDLESEETAVLESPPAAPEPGNSGSQPDGSTEGEPISHDNTVSSSDAVPDFHNDSTETDLVLKEYNLAVPFMSQAPHANLGVPYQEACEEASLIMADAFFSGKGLTADTMDANIKKLVQWEIERFGYYEDTTSEEVALIAREYFNLHADLDYIVSVQNIKKHLSNNKLVLVPAAGRELPNPNFTGEGPLYHMLVIRGYTDEYFITNDPGTRRGEAFVYQYNDLISAIHDWTREPGGQKDAVSEEDMLKGKPVIIVVSR